MFQIILGIRNNQAVAASFMRTAYSMSHARLKCVVELFRALHSMNNRSVQPPRVWSQWSNRILILSLLGIIYFTFFPFRIDFASPQSRTTSPFLLGPSLKHGVHLDFFLNVLLFIPFGFGFSALLRKRGVSKSL